MCTFLAEEEGLSASAIEKLSKLKVFQHLRERHKNQPQKVCFLLHLLENQACAGPSTMVSRQDVQLHPAIDCGGTAHCLVRQLAGLQQKKFCQN